MAAAYVEAYRSGRLRRKIETALRQLKKCSLCPRLCRVNRLADEKGVCRTGRYAVVSSYGPHFGEEDPLVGRNGRGPSFSPTATCCAFSVKITISATKATACPHRPSSLPGSWWSCKTEAATISTS